MYVKDKQTNVVYSASEATCNQAGIERKRSLDAPGFVLTHKDEVKWIEAYQLLSKYRILTDTEVLSSADLVGGSTLEPVVLNVVASEDRQQFIPEPGTYFSEVNVASTVRVLISDVTGGFEGNYYGPGLLSTAYSTQPILNMFIGDNREITAYNVAIFDSGNNVTTEIATSVSLLEPDRNTLVIQVTGELTFGESYKIAYMLNGNPSIAGEVPFTCLAPLTITPARNASEVSVNTTITLEAPGAIDENQISIQLLGPTFQLVEHTMVVSPSNLITLTPTAPLSGSSALYTMYYTVVAGDKVYSGNTSFNTISA